jgi:FkbM family methyltransferase
MREREYIDNFFKDRLGRFLEIGAYNGVDDSITLGLVEAGWEGVMVEPDPTNFLGLLKNHGSNKKLQLVNTAVATKTGLSHFWGNPSGQRGTLSQEFSDTEVKPSGDPQVEYTIAAISLSRLFSFFGGPKNWQFVLIDAEGCNKALTALLPLKDMVDTELMCIEWEHGPEELIPLISDYYTVVEIIPPNIIAQRK